jgi:uracil-DNA glycosylase family 4
MDSRCSNCPLFDSPFIEGTGPIEKEGCLFVIGTAPGETEERLRRPFAGEAGGMLREILRDMGVEREVYFTNVLKRRPLSYDGTDRKPSKRECWKCGSHLMAELALAKPRVVLTLGQMPLQFFFGKKHDIEKIHGLPFHLVKFQLVMKVVPTFDPSFVRRRGGLMSHVGNRWVSDIEDAVNMAQEEGVL